jgi:response regulator of citrate/malate metabolism
MTTRSPHWSHRHPERVARGTNHPCAKLTAEQVVEMRELAERYRASELARYYGVSRVTIWRYLKCFR